MSEQHTQETQQEQHTHMLEVKMTVNPGLEVMRGLFLLQLLFLGLWLGDVITWHWMWVFTPMWLLPASLLAATVLALLATLASYPFRKRNEGVA